MNPFKIPDIKQEDQSKERFQSIKLSPDYAKIIQLNNKKTIETLEALLEDKTISLTNTVQEVLAILKQGRLYKCVYSS